MIKRLTENKLIYISIFLMLVSLLSSLRGLFTPLHGDEFTYVSLAESMVKNGEFVLNGSASTVIPIVPSIIACFHFFTSLETSIILSRALQFMIALIGLFYVYKSFKILKVTDKFVLPLLCLVAVNSNFIVGITKVYPDSILFCFLWILLFHLLKKEKGLTSWFIIFMSCAALVLTRYSYAVIGLPVLIELIRHLKRHGLWRPQTVIMILMIVVTSLPILLWVYYVSSIESEQVNGISYFNRFKNHGLWYNVQAGLGFIQHHEVGKINGIPAFASLFIPITGLRTWFLSVPLLIVSLTGLFFYINTKNNLLLLVAMLIMLSFVFAGTGFSRYWLPLLPVFIYSIYLLFRKLNVSTVWLTYGVILLSMIYVLNELRLNIMVYHKYFEL